MRVLLLSNLLFIYLFISEYICMLVAPHHFDFTGILFIFYYQAVKYFLFYFFEIII